MYDIACTICEELYSEPITQQPPNQTQYQDFRATTASSTIINTIMTTLNSTIAEHLLNHNWTISLHDNNTDLSVNSTLSTEEYDVEYFNSTTMSTPTNNSNISLFCYHYCPEKPHHENFSEIFYTEILPQIILAVLAIFLNTTEILLMKKRKKYYPSEYLMISLAVADLMFSTFVLITLCISSLTFHSAGSTYRAVLEIVDTLIAFSIFASILHVVAISLDRLVAVFFPLRHRVRTDAIKMKRVVAGIWCLTVIFIGSLSVHQFQKGIVSEDDESPVPSQTTNHPSHTTNQVVSILMLVSAALVALIYLAITRRLAIQANFLNSLYSKKQKSHHTQQNRPQSRRNQIETVALFTAGVVTVAFLVCTLPYACYHMIDYYSDMVGTLSLCLLICNSVCNPLVYFWRGYWLKSKRRKNTTTTTRMTYVSRSKSKEDSSQQHQNTLTSLAQSVGVAFIPIRTNIAGMRKSKTKKYNLSEVTVMDIFDFDSISRFKRFERSYYNQGRQFQAS